ncbi:hypothetical protein AC578_629 [Pseudocercospora eumusae]|uniref:C2H2-type domain-containing protein n=1 Tax=Pseudocercospora eumusae TaxID=321146 RepID=A0A139HFC7_9PEZI|nr:hypothetical protein AC578_629 [Pseudocercospora eumusae]
MPLSDMVEASAADSDCDSDGSIAIDADLEAEDEVDQPQRTQEQGNQPRGDFPCLESSCGKVFKRVGLLHQHQRHAHPNERLFHCEICDKAYKTKSHLTEHKKSRRHKLRLAVSVEPSAMPEPQNADSCPGLRKVAQSRGTYVCSRNECGKVFDIASRFRRHEKTSHRNKQS